MPRVIRRQSTYQRVLSFLNPLDHLLRLATDYEAFDWDNWQNAWGMPLGIVLNASCMIARGYAEKFRRAGVDDVFRQTSGGSNSVAAGLSYFVCDMSMMAAAGGKAMACRPLDVGAGDGLCSFFAFVGKQLWFSSCALAAFSVGNAVYCFTRKKRYRLFESNIEVEPATPSARRVPVNSSPIANSPMRVLGSMIEPFRNDAASRAHPDETKDVWEVGVWDPTPLSLHLFSIFSPVHVAIYFLSLPVTSGPTIVSYESSSSNTSSAAVYLTVIVTQVLLSLQIIVVKSWFMQQAADHKIISKEVMHEYDQKYVHPRLNVIKRDVAVQCTMGSSSGTKVADVQVYTPQFNRSGFRTYANPNYADLTMESQLPSQQFAAAAAARTPRGVFKGMSPFAGSSSMRQTSDANSGRSMNTSTSMDEGIVRPARERQLENHTGYDQPVRRMGTEGLVDWSRHNSRGLSPSKSSTPLKKGSSIHGSTYAESLGTTLGTPVRRRQF